MCRKAARSDEEPIGKEPVRSAGSARPPLQVTSVEPPPASITTVGRSGTVGSADRPGERVMRFLAGREHPHRQTAAPLDLGGELIAVAGLAQRVGGDHGDSFRAQPARVFDESVDRTADLIDLGEWDRATLDRRTDQREGASSVDRNEATVTGVCDQQRGGVGTDVDAGAAHRPLIRTRSAQRAGALDRPGPLTCRT